MVFPKECGAFYKVSGRLCVTVSAKIVSLLALGDMRFALGGFNMAGFRPRFFL